MAMANFVKLASTTVIEHIVLTLIRILDTDDSISILIRYLLLYFFEKMKTIRSFNIELEAIVVLLCFLR